MRLFIIILLSSLTLLYASQELFDKVESFKLKNGMKVYMLDHNESTLSKIVIRVHTGFRAETQKTSGISHLLEHLIFRDIKIGDKDYLNIIKDNGSKYINAYTSKYHTDYICKIDSSKSEWIVKTFKSMLFNKELSDALFKKEQNIVQTEIGKITWSDTFGFYYDRIEEKLTPKKESFLEQNFEFEKEDKLYDYYDQRNNPKFTLKDIMDHYNSYYYPSNMELFIVGDFDKGKMKDLIQKEFGTINKSGTKTIREPQSAKLKPIASNRYTFNNHKNKAYIGFRYFDNDPKKHMVLDAYMYYLKSKIRKELRTKDAKLYGITTADFYKHNAMISYIYFDGLNDSFETNINKAQKLIDQGIQNISDKDIKEALKLYKVESLTIENDANDLMYILLDQFDLEDRYKFYDKNYYELFESITPSEFREIVEQNFTPSSRIEQIKRSDYLFPEDMDLMILFLLIIFVMFYFNIFYGFLPFSSKSYTHRDILMHHNLSNSFIDFILAVFVLYIALFITDWIEYLLALLFFAKGGYLRYELGTDYYYLWYIANFAILTTIYILLYRLINYHIKFFVTYDGIVLVSSRKSRLINKEDIESIEVVPFSKTNLKERIGTIFRFWKPLLHIRLKNGTNYYLRSTHANHTKEDIATRLKCKKGD